MNNIIILAAGKGTRMKSDLPKVMQEIQNKPLIEYVISIVEGFGVKPVVVVSEDDTVKNYLGDRADYVFQTERLGTGHAVMQTEELLKNKIGRTDFPGGDLKKVKASIRMLKARFEDVNIFPGHFQNTTLRHELENNKKLIEIINE